MLKGIILAVLWAITMKLMHSQGRDDERRAWRAYTKDRYGKWWRGSPRQDG